MVTLTAALGVGATLASTASPRSWAANNNETAWNFFTGKGLSQAQTAGLIGNFIVESGADPINPASEQHGGGPGRGIAQWEGSRRSELYAYADSRGLAWSNLGLQLDFVWKEFTSTESAALAKIKATTTPSAAAVAVRKYYERPSAHADQARISAAELIYSRYGDGSTPPPSDTTFPLLKSGASGAAVTTAQYLLRGKGQKLDVDGRFGPGTLAAAKAFQKAQGLVVDGVIGPRTWLALVPKLRNGSKGDAVRALQSELKIEIDGSFGPATEKAVRSHQDKAGLEVDGVVGPITWGSLIS
ncbi:MAG TPA: peptidoglycan-binding protein [Candidatus Avipropionibacterium avicola]|uniref:Peptidoglycan-binding protein n=1 Tax=Candidatus Avipropionibacterium avicola TaxID=2840701 RepID=A0A9D1KM68_9ACTN|nr:peptidoglycan-binding protein [Candidatus Avipropionibacterium avicola]